MADSQKKTANLLNPETSEQGCYYDGSGEYHASVAHDESDYIPIVQGNSYTFYTYKAGSLAYGIFINAYDSNKEFSSNIVYLGNPTFSGYYTFVAPITGYVRFNYLDRSELSANTMFYEGSSHLPYEPYWQHSLRKLTTATEAVENPLYSDGTPITAYTLKGNEEHTGTPSPQNPVMPNGVGERTENLFDKTAAIQGKQYNENGVLIDAESNWYATDYIPVTGGETYIRSINAYGIGSAYNEYDSQKNFIARYTPTYGTPFTVGENTAYITFSINSTNTNLNDYMFNTGSTAKPYEPYGFKIPISSGGVTTNIYLGSASSTRRIKKMTFTGNESWQVSSAWKKTNTSVFFYNQSDIEPTVSTTKIYVMSDKFEATSRDGLYNGDSDMIAKTGGVSMTIRVSDSIATTTQAFKAWLASNPVTAWYVLATAETAAVNEPLMKIGDYADTLSNATAIPTTEGANSITVDTTVQPSEFTATWTGWHDAEVKEKSENLWNEDYPNISSTVQYIPLYVGSGNFTMSSDAPLNTGNGRDLFFLAGNVSTGANSGQNGVSSNQTKTVTAVDGYVTVAYRTLGGTSPDIRDYHSMLNTGSTALPYEPYWK